MASASGIKLRETGRTPVSLFVFCIAEFIAAFTAHDCFFVCYCMPAERMIFKLIVTFVAGIEFTADTAFVCNDVEFSVIVQAASFVVCEVTENAF